MELIYYKEMAFILRPAGNIRGQLFESYLGHGVMDLIAIYFVFIVIFKKKKPNNNKQRKYTRSMNPHIQDGW